MKFKIQKNISDYTPSNCVAVWDNAIDSRIFPEMKEAKWQFTNTALEDGRESGLISWIQKITSWENTGDNNPYIRADKIVKDWKTLSKGFPFLDQARDIVFSKSEDSLKITRSWINGQTYGLGDDVHRDVQIEDGEHWKFLTFIFYCNKEWGPGWGGETVIYDENYDVLRAITPKPGRLIAFDSRLLHQGKGPNRHIVDLRMTLSFHTVIDERTEEKDGKQNRPL